MRTAWSGNPVPASRPSRQITLIGHNDTLPEPWAAATFPPSVAAALPSTGMRAGIAELSFTSASMIAAVTSILAGSGAALLLDAVGVPLAAAVIVGVAATLLV
jgi:hypothetical protein